MHRQGHVGASLLAYAPLGTAVAGAGAIRVAVAGAVLAAWLSSVPDWDRLIPAVDHRGATHTVGFALLVGGLGGGICALGADAASGAVGPSDAVAPGPFGFAVGVVAVLSHLAADGLTPAGVRPLRPVSSRRVALPVATASDPLANYVLLVLGVGATGSWVWGIRAGLL